VNRVQLNFGFNPTSGFNGVSPDITFAAAQGGLQWSQGGAAWTNVAYPNASPQASVFSEYRIKTLSIDLFYSQSGNDQAPTASTDALPMVACVVDVESDQPLTSSGNALSYATCRVMQFGTSTNGGKQTISQRQPVAFGIVENNATLVGTQVGALVMRNQWLSTLNYNIPHGFIKLWMLAPPVSTNAVIGFFTMIATTIVEYRGIE